MERSEKKKTRTIYCGEIYRETTGKLGRNVKEFVKDRKESNGSQRAEIYAWKLNSGKQRMTK